MRSSWGVDSAADSAVGDDGRGELELEVGRSVDIYAILYNNGGVIQTKSQDSKPFKIE